MKHIGLTGGIGSGKSTVAAIFAELGATLIDADAVSRDLMRRGSPVLAEVVKTFGPEILTADGDLNRSLLSDIIFESQQQRERLNAIVHPAIRRRSAELVEAAQRNPDFSGLVVEDIPLLAETGQADRFDEVVVVYADQKTRVRRLVEQRHMDEADALARIAAQATDAERESIATWIIDNSGDLAETRKQVVAVWKAIGKSCR